MGVRVERVYRKADEVFKGYTINHLKKQTLAMPFGGFRIDAMITYQEGCEDFNIMPIIGTLPNTLPFTLA